MGLVKVWNDNVHPHSENFKGSVIRIEPGKYVEMEHEDAVDFMGQFTPIVVDGGGNHDPRGYKKLRLDAPPVVAAVPLVNHATGQIATTPEALRAMLAESAHLRTTDAEAETALASENARLKAEIEALKAANAPRKPGRPPTKQATA